MSRSSTLDRGTIPVHAAAGIAAFLVTVNASMVAVVLPELGTRFGVGFGTVQWVLSGYSLVFAALLLSSGALADRIGASRAVAAGLGVFTASSVLCALAPDLGVLIGARLAQGLAAAMILPASLSLLRETVPDGVRRDRAIAGWSACMAAALVAGPLVGGGLSTAFGWAAPFWLNVPLGVAGLAAMWWVTPSVRRPVRFDLPGQVSAIVALLALTYAVIRVGAAGFDWLAGGSALLCVLAAGAFVLIERRTTDPLLPIGVLTDRSVVVGYTIGFAINFAVNGVVLVVTFLVRHALTASLVLLPMMVLVLLATGFTGPLTTRFGRAGTMTGGLLIVLCGLIGLTATAPQAPLWLLIAWTVPVGVGGGLVVPLLTTTLLSGVPPERVGVAGGLLNAARQVGSGMAAAGIGSVVSDARIGLLITVVVIAAACWIRMVW